MYWYNTTEVHSYIYVLLYLINGNKYLLDNFFTNWTSTSSSNLRKFNTANIAPTPVLQDRDIEHVKKEN